MREKGCDRETAWTMIQDHKEDDLRKKMWAEQDARKHMEHAIDEDQIRLYWKMINPENKNHVFQVFRKDGKATAPVNVSSVNDLIALCKRHNLEGLSCLSVNPTKKAETINTASILSLDDIPVDIDVKKERKQDGVSTPEDKQAALETTQKAIRKLEEEINLRVSLFVDSGNSGHIHIPVHIDLSGIFTGKNEDENHDLWEKSEVKARLVYLENQLKEAFNDDVVEIDCISKDIARRMKIPGTWNVKEGISEENYRLSQILEAHEDVLTSVFVEGNTTVFHSFPCAKEQNPVLLEGGHLPPDFQEILQKDDKLRDLYEGRWEKHGDGRTRWTRSEAEMSLLCKLVWYEVPEDQIYEVMEQSKIGKWLGSSSQYKKHQIAKARKYIASHGGTKSVAACVIPSTINAKLEGKNVKVTGRIVAENIKKAIPKTISWACSRCDKKCKKVEPVPSRKAFVFRGKKSIGEVIKNIRSKPICERQNEDGDLEPSWFGTVHEYDDYTIVWLNDRLEDQTDLKSGDHRLMVALVGHEIPKRRIVSVTGYVAVNPHSSDLVIIASGIEEVGTSAENIVIDDDTKEAFKQHFGDTKRILNQVAPDMIGRDLVRHSRLLVLHSPVFIPDIQGKRIRGSLREVLFGDTKTNKSECMKDVLSRYHFGEWCSAETGSRAGLLFLVDKEKDTITWGVIPLSDLGYVGVESINALHSDQWAQFREVLEDQRVKVTMAVHGVANARTRITATMNPLKNMSEYLCKCQAIPDTFIFRNSPDVTRWDIFLPFCYDDIDQDLIIDREHTERPIPDDIFTKHVYWAWGISPEDIRYEPDAIVAIKKETKSIINDFASQSIPIVHSGSRDTLTRLSVATAILNHSTDDCKTLLVRKRDVDEAAHFYRDMLESLDLQYYRNLELGIMSIGDDDLRKILSDFDDIHIEILNRILLKPRSSTVLAEALKVSEKTIKRHYEELTKHELIVAIQGKGVSLSKKGIAFVKKIHALKFSQKIEKGSSPRDRDTNVPMSLDPLDKLRSFLPNNNGDDNEVKKTGQQNIENEVHSPDHPRDIGTKMSPSLEEEGKSDFSDKNEDMQKIGIKKSQHDKISEIRNYCWNLTSQGNLITRILLEDHFDSVTISHLIESGQLVRVPNKDGFEIYGWHQKKGVIE